MAWQGSAGEASLGMPWRGLAWLGRDWHGRQGWAWRGKDGRGVAWLGMAWRGMAWRGEVMQEMKHPNDDILPGYVGIRNALYNVQIEKGELFDHYDEIMEQLWGYNMEKWNRMVERDDRKRAEHRSR